MADIPLDNITGEVCEPVGGIAGKIYFAEHSDFTTITDPKELCGDSADAAATLAELVTTPANGLVLKAGKKFNVLDIVLETGEVTTTQIGEKKRRLFQNQIVGQVAGSGANLLGFMRLIKNKDLVVLVEEVGSGNIRQFGSNRLPAWIEAQEQKIEATLEGNNSLTITVMDKQKFPAPIYAGDITTTVVPPVGG